MLAPSRRYAAKKPRAKRRANPKTPTRLSGKKLDKAIEAAWYRIGSGVQVDIMDIGKIFRDVAKHYEGGGSIDDGVTVAVAKYRKNPAVRKHNPRFKVGSTVSARGEPETFGVVRRLPREPFSVYHVAWDEGRSPRVAGALIAQRHLVKANLKPKKNPSFRQGAITWHEQTAFTFSGKKYTDLKGEGAGMRFFLTAPSLHGRSLIAAGTPSVKGATIADQVGTVSEAKRKAEAWLKRRGSLKNPAGDEITRGIRVAAPPFGRKNVFVVGNGYGPDQYVAAPKGMDARTVEGHLRSASWMGVGDFYVRPVKANPKSTHAAAVERVTARLHQVDSQGRTARQAAYGAPDRNSSGWPAFVGMLHHSPTRWSWAVRFIRTNEKQHFDDGSTFEPVASVAGPWIQK